MYLCVFYLSFFDILRFKIKLGSSILLVFILMKVSLKFVFIVCGKGDILSLEFLVFKVYRFRILIINIIVSVVLRYFYMNIFGGVFLEIDICEKMKVK